MGLRPGACDCGSAILINSQDSPDSITSDYSVIPINTVKLPRFYYNLSSKVKTPRTIWNYNCMNRHRSLHHLATEKASITWQFTSGWKYSGYWQVDSSL